MSSWRAFSLTINIPNTFDMIRMLDAVSATISTANAVDAVSHKILIASVSDFGGVEYILVPFGSSPSDLS